MGKRKTDAEFRTEVKALVGDEYTFLEPYKSSRTKILVKHNKCGHTYLASPNNFLRNRNCPFCSRKNRSQALRDQGKKRFQKIVSQLTNKYKIIGNYVDHNSIMLCKCLTCGYVWQTKAKEIMRHHGCLQCAINKNAQKRKHDNEWLKKQIHKEVGNEYILISSYQRFNEKVKIKHIKCGRIYSVTPNKFLYGSRCPYCNSSISRGERCTESYLKKRHLTFESQYWTKECKDKYVLPFDFAVFNSDKTLNCLIEYQGFQHFINPFSYHNQFFSKESVLRTQKHDAMKLKYCKDHGIKLIRINHPQTSNKSNSIEFIERLVNRTLDKELKVS